MNEFLTWLLDTVQGVDPVVRTIVAGVAIMLETSVLVGLVVPGDTIVITAVVLGGTSIFGGRGSVIGTLLGLVLIQVLKNGLALSGVKGDGTIVIIGVVVVLFALALVRGWERVQEYDVAVDWSWPVALVLFALVIVFVVLR